MSKTDKLDKKAQKTIIGLLRGNLKIYQANLRASYLQILHQRAENARNQIQRIDDILRISKPLLTLQQVETLNKCRNQEMVSFKLWNEQVDREMANRAEAREMVYWLKRILSLASKEFNMDEKGHEK